MSNALQGRFLLYLISSTLLLYALNLRVVFNVDRFNPIEKSMWLLIFLTLAFGKSLSRGFYYFITLVLVLLFFLIFFVDYPSFSFSIFLFSITQIPIFFALINMKIPFENAKRIIFTFSLMPLLVVFFGFLYQILGIKAAYGIEFATGMPRLQGTTSAAFLAGWCIAACYSSFKLYSLENRIIHLLLYVVNLFFLLLTVARFPLLVTAVVSAAIFFQAKSNVFSARKKVLFFLFSCFFAFGLFLYFFESYSSRITNSGSSGRDLIWDYLLYEYEFYFKDWGAGFGHQYLIVPENLVALTSTVAAHNEYIRLLVELGLWGSIFFWFLTLIYFIYVIGFRVAGSKLEATFALFIFFSFCYFDNVIATPAIFSFFFCLFLINNSVSNFNTQT